MLLENKVAIITGGAKGMGRATALKFAKEGCSVAIADISTKEAKETLAEVSRIGKEGLFVRCDVTETKEVNETVAGVLDKYGQIDIMVNNAGSSAPSPSIEYLTDEDWDRVLDINLKSVFFFCRAVVPHMKQRKSGKIINVSSLGALYPHAEVVHYGAAKAGVLGLTYGLAQSLAPYNICVNAILPGLVHSHFYDKLLEDMPDKDAFFQEGAKCIPLQRPGVPDDIAGAALYLASDLSNFVTGTTINVSGGEPLTPVGQL